MRLLITIIQAQLDARFTTDRLTALPETLALSNVPHSSPAQVEKAGGGLHPMAISLQADTPRATCGQGSRQARKGDKSRAPFSCSTKAPCPLHAQTGKPCTTSQTATSRGFAGQSIHTLVQTQHSTVQPAHSCSTYRDEGSLSEITIADYLSDSALQSSRDGVQVEHASTLYSVQCTTYSSSSFAQNYMGQCYSHGPLLFASCSSL